MNVSERLAASAVVPVVVLDDAKDAVPTCSFSVNWRFLAEHI